VHAGSLDRDPVAADRASVDATRDRSQQIARNVVVRSVAEVVSKAASLAFFVILARELGSEPYGAFSFALALSGAVLLGAGFGTDDLIARETARHRERAPRHLADVAGLKALTSVPLLGATMLVIALGDYSTETRIGMLAVGVGVALEIMAKSWQAIFQGYERLDLASACVIVQRVFTAVVGSAVVLAGGGLLEAGLAFLAGAALGLLVAEVGVRRTLRVPRVRPDRHGAWQLLRAGVPIGIAGLLFMLLLRVDVMMLSFLGGAAEVGLYSAAYRLVEGCQFLSWVFGGAMLPWLAGAASAADLRRALTLGLKFEAAVLLPIGLAFTCFADPLIRLLYTDAYAGSVLPLQLLGLTVATYGLQSFASITLIARDAPATMTRVLAVVALQNVVCNLIVIPRAGAAGAAAVALSSGVLLAGLAVWQASRRGGGLEFSRAFGGPAAGAAAMMAVALLAPLPWALRAVVAFLAYAAVLLAVELRAHREDVLAYLSALPPAARARIPLG
jgi:lipopolysaccharide exporter